MRYAVCGMRYAVCGMREITFRLKIKFLFDSLCPEPCALCLILSAGQHDKQAVADHFNAFFS